MPASKLMSEEELVDMLTFRMARQAGMHADEFRYDTFVREHEAEARTLARRMLAADAMYEALRRVHQPYRTDYKHMTAVERGWANEYLNEGRCESTIAAALKLADEGGR